MSEADQPVGPSETEPPAAPWRFHGLVAGYAVSVYGNYLSLIALSLFSYEVTGSALGLGLLMALRLSAGVLAGVVAGRLAARRNRRMMMIGADLAQAVVMAVLALAGEGAAIPLVAAVVIVLGAGNAMFNVALRTAIPVITGQAGRVRANGRLVTARSLATVLGFASAAPVIAAGGYQAAFALNAASFLVSATALALLRPRTNPTAAEQRAEDELAEGGYKGPVESAERASGPSAVDATPEPQPQPKRRLRLRLRLRTRTRTRTRTRPLLDQPALPAILFAMPVLAAMVVLRGIDALASSSHNVGLPVAANEAGAQDAALLMAQFWVAWAVGGIVAHQLASRLGARWQALLGERGFALGTCLMSLAFIAAFAGMPGPVMMAAALVAGVADGYTDIAYTSRIQAEPDRVRGRLFGLSTSAETSGFAIGMLAAAAALEALPVLWVVVLFHGAAFCAAAVFLALLPRLRARTDEPPANPGPGPGPAPAPAPGPGPAPAPAPGPGPAPGPAPSPAPGPTPLPPPARTPAPEGAPVPPSVPAPAGTSAATAPRHRTTRRDPS